ncbi:hypothetical protein IMSHALPRED_006227 [Imshaugia aleurites]|uniref:Uncharacterized protein n=1 Tax=Imshaugia aleurites TaxID=172621 RepID=A0A8H3FH58_9LECA|nr:hypothetical protein IMSHALPRED_006227 [Imshaugia aleurites]
MDEQDPQVPGTQTGDQQMPDADQAGPSQEGTPMTGLGDRPPHVPTRRELALAAFKRGAELFAEEEERKEKSRNGASLSTFVGKPTSSAAPSQNPRKRTESFQKAEEPSKRRHVRQVHPSQAVGGPAIAAPVTVSDSRTEDPNATREENPSTSALAVPEAPALSTPTPFRWTDIRNPRKPLPCLVQVNNLRLIGSFAEDSEDWAFHVTFDAGRRRPPTMSMRFFSDGLDGPSCGQIDWSLSNFNENDGMVTKFKIHRVADSPEDEGKRRRHDLAACRTDEERARLICITIEAWPKSRSYLKKDSLQRNPNPGVKKLTSFLFQRRKSYRLRICVLAPDDSERFEELCLSCFTRYFQQREIQREIPDDQLYDADGVSFADHLKAQQKASSTGNRLNAVST